MQLSQLIACYYLLRAGNPYLCTVENHIVTNYPGSYRNEV
jgi:hypothetical protein